MAWISRDSGRFHIGAGAAGLASKGDCEFASFHLPSPVLWVLCRLPVIPSFLGLDGFAINTRGFCDWRCCALLIASSSRLSCATRRRHGAEIPDTVGRRLAFNDQLPVGAGRNASPLPCLHSRRVTPIPSGPQFQVCSDHAVGHLKILAILGLCTSVIALSYALYSAGRAALRRFKVSNLYSNASITAFPLGQLNLG